MCHTKMENKIKFLLRSFCIPIEALQNWSFEHVCKIKINNTVELLHPVIDYLVDKRKDRPTVSEVEGIM